MSSYKRKINFFETEEGVEFLKTLHTMKADTAYSTEPSYSSNTDRYPDNLIPFVEKHVEYLLSHPSANPQHYLSNLRLMTKIR